MSILLIVLAVLGAWLLVSVVVALMIGRAIRLADKDYGRKVAYSAKVTPLRARTS